jgi:phytoene dehydrogenase-like protein
MKVVVIGSGINGLVAAAQLSLAGHEAVVLERLDRPGGAVRTEELTLPGFRHDVGAMNVSMFAGSGFHKAHAQSLATHGLEFVPVNRPFASVFPNGDYFGVSTDIEETLSTIPNQDDKAAWKAAFEMFPARSGALLALLSARMSKRGLTKAGWQIFRSLGPSGLFELSRLIVSSPRNWVEQTFSDPRLHAALSTWGLHLDFAPDISGGAIFPYLESFGAQAMGMVIGKGGADTVTRSLIKLIESQGGQVRCEAEVASITVSGGHARGVQLANGETVQADRVLANVAPRGLLRMLSDHTGDARFDQSMKAFRHAPGTMMIHLALSGLPGWQAQALRKFAYVHIGPSIDTLAQTYQQAMAGLLPSQPVLVVGQPTVYDASRAPEGKHVLWVQVRCLPALVRGDAAGVIQGCAWRDIKEVYADRVIQQMEQYAPGLSSLILKRRVVSPLDLEAENPNLVGGDQICGSHHLFQNFLFRPVPGFADGHTPVKGLHMVGAAVWPGAGTGAGSGYMVAQALRG